MFERFDYDGSRLLDRDEQERMKKDLENQRRVRKEGRKEGNVIFNDALNTFYLQLYGVGHMAKDHSDSGWKEGRKCFI